MRAVDGRHARGVQEHVRGRDAQPLRLERAAVQQRGDAGPQADVAGALGEEGRLGRRGVGGGAVEGQHGERGGVREQLQGETRRGPEAVVLPGADDAGGAGGGEGDDVEAHGGHVDDVEGEVGGGQGGLLALGRGGPGAGDAEGVRGDPVEQAVSGGEA